MQPKATYPQIIPAPNDAVMKPDSTRNKHMRRTARRRHMGVMSPSCTTRSGRIPASDSSRRYSSNSSYQQRPQNEPSSRETRSEESRHVRGADPWLTENNFDLVFDAVRADARWRKLRREMGFAE
jgi:hypothetical protein